MQLQIQMQMQIQMNFQNCRGSRILGDLELSFYAGFIDVKNPS